VSYSVEYAARQLLRRAYQALRIGVSITEDTASSPATMTICTSYSFNFLAPELLPYGPLNLTHRVTVPLI